MRILAQVLEPLCLQIVSRQRAVLVKLEVIAEPGLYPELVDQRFPDTILVAFLSGHQLQSERNIVEVAFFVSERGQVTHSYILNSTGGPIFNDVVLKAVNQWLYQPVWHNGLPPQGFWNRLTIRFKSPYSNS